MPNVRTAVLLLDLQPAFMDAIKPHPADLIPAVNQLLADATVLGLPIIAVRTEHLADRSTWTLNMRKDGQGFAFPQDPASAFHPELSLPPGTTCLTKTRDSAFFRTGLDDLLGYLRIGALWIAGTAAGSCVEHTGRDAYERNIEVTYVQDAIADQSVKIKEAVLRRLAEQFRQQAADSAEMLERLHGPDMPALAGQQR